MTDRDVDIILPVYNEDLGEVRSILDRIRKAVADVRRARIIVINDGSDPNYGLASLREEEGITYVEHEVNRGYGSALKTGIRSGMAPWIAISDVDGTYPVERIPDLLEDMQDHDMVIGARTGEIKRMPWLRRFPKAMLNRFASYLAGVRIVDLNSGLRVFQRNLCYGLWGILPPAFSFTSTMTMGAVMGGFRVKYTPINYHKRVGRSSISPVKDTLRFFYIVLRLGLLFSPMKIFAPMSSLLFLVGVVKGLLIDFIRIGYVGNLSVFVMLTAVQIFMMGLLGEMIVNTRNVKLSEVEPKETEKRQQSGR